MAACVDPTVGRTAAPARAWRTGPRHRVRERSVRRRMAELGADVLATDFSEGMLERARSHGGDVEYRLADATDERALLSLGEPGSFDAVISNMAMMDMESIESMSAAASRLLRESGRLDILDVASCPQLWHVRPHCREAPEGSEVYSVRCLRRSSVHEHRRRHPWSARSNSGTSIDPWDDPSSRSSRAQVRTGRERRGPARSSPGLEARNDPLTSTRRSRGVLVARMRRITARVTGWATSPAGRRQHVFSAPARLLVEIRYPDCVRVVKSPEPEPAPEPSEGSRSSR